MLALTAAATAKDFWVYFGTYTNALSRGIYVSRLDASTGKLSAPELAVATPSPCFLAVLHNQENLYAATSVKSFNGEDAGAISAFALDRRTGQLALLNEKSSGGSGPCHVSVDATEKILFAANYGSGSVKSFSLAADGQMGADDSVIQQHGSSVNTSRQTGPHAHFICADPSNHFALACDLGADKVMIYKIGADGALMEHSFAVVPPGAGARHLAFSRDGKFAYVINEMGCSLSQFRWNARAGELTPVETISALPPGVAVQNNFTAAEILVHPSGKFVYATIRGHDSVSVFSVDKKSGRLKFLQNISSGGQLPRGLGIDPTGCWLFTGNQKTDNAVEFSINPQTGELSPAGRELRIGSPVDVKFVAVK